MPLYSWRLAGNKFPVRNAAIESVITAVRYPKKKYHDPSDLGGIYVAFGSGALTAGKKGMGSAGRASLPVPYLCSW